MKIKLLAFGMAADAVGNREWEMEIASPITAIQLREILNGKHTKLAEIKTYALAINQQYALDEDLISDNDEIAIIPPVSGG